MASLTLKSKLDRKINKWENQTEFNTFDNAVFQALHTDPHIQHRRVICAVTGSGHYPSDTGMAWYSDISFSVCRRKFFRINA